MTWRKDKKPSLDALIEANGAAQNAKKQCNSHPTNMTPGIKYDPNSGIGEAIVAVPAGQKPEWDRLLAKMGFGDVIEFLEVSEVRAWETFSKDAYGKGNPGTVQLQYIKAKVLRRQTADEKLDIEQICEMVAKKKAKKIVSPSDGLSLALNLADWQLGKRDGGGTKAIVERILEMFDKVIHHLKRLRKIGLKISRLIVSGMGDIVENCDNFYPMQTFSVDLHLRNQRKVARRLLIKMFELFAPHFEFIDVIVVPGNHGENRKDGKAFTSFADNDDVAVFEQVADALAMNEDAFGHISFQIPDEELTLTRDVDGVVLGFAHGHQARGNKTARMKDWWDDVAAARTLPVGQADILVCAHLHHLIMLDCGGRNPDIGHHYGKTLMQCPTLDGGSKWFAEGGGEGSVQGTLSFVVDPNNSRGWSHAEVL